MDARQHPRPYNPELSQAKLEQVILYFLHRAQNERLGKTKLMKLLYYADFDHYEEHDHPITGARYRKLPQGPVPDEAFDALDRLVAEGRVCLDVVSTMVGDQHRYSPIAEVDLSLFSQSEIDVLGGVVERWGEAPSAEIVEAAHDEAPWIAARDMGVIPYHLAFYRNRFGEMDMDDEFAGLESEDLEEIVLK